MFTRFATGLPRFLWRPLTLEEARRIVETAFAQREENFLRTVRKGIYQNERSPYKRILEWAGAEFGDIESLVRSDGIEGALEKLFAAGVYVRMEELKGRKPVRRGQMEFPVTDRDFDNPFFKKQFETHSGGSRGVRRRHGLDLDSQIHESACHLLYLQDFNLLDRPMCVWRPRPPNASGMAKCLHQVKSGLKMDSWFSQEPIARTLSSARFEVFTAYFVMASALMGRRIPWPRYLPVSRAIEVARWLGRMKDAGTPGVLDGSGGCAVRACITAKEHGIDIAGSFVRQGGEPLTPGKAKVYSDVGVEAHCHYSMGEAGHAGIGCGAPEALDDIHVLESKLAVLLKPTPAPSGVGEIDVVYFTSLAPWSPKLLFNADTGDYAKLVRRTCGCSFGQIGMHTHLHTIRGYDKLTSEGVTFIGDDMYTLLEVVLPERFGGYPSYYQFVEQEEGGLTKMCLVVSPRVGDVNEGEVLSTVFSFLGDRNQVSRLWIDTWRDGNTLTLLRREPYASPASKILPLSMQRN